MIEHTFNAALASRSLASVFVTTNDPTVADIASRMGVKVLKQPEDVSSDDSRSIDALQWAAREISQFVTEVETVAILRATTPLRSGSDIDEAIRMFESNAEANSLVSVVEAVGCAQERLKRILDGWVIDLKPEGYSPRQRQNLEPVYIRNGGIYLVDIELLRTGQMWGDACLAYVMPPERSINVNSAYDLMIVDLLMSHAASESSSSS